MRRDPDALNRFILSLLGLALVALAVWGVGRGAGWFDADHPDQPLLLGDVRRFVARNAHWFWPVVAAAGLLIAVLAAGWLRAQFRLPRQASNDVVVRRPSGTTRIGGDAMAGALEEDVVSSVDRVRKASARVVGDAEDAEIDLRVEVDEDADLTGVRRRIETEVLPRFARAAGLARTTTYLDLRLERGSRQVA